VLSPTGAVVVLLVLHVPPPKSLSVVVSPLHTDAVPIIADGNGLIVYGTVAIQPAGNV